ncbi:MAG: hypothetical protein AAF125_13505 [Chloroflexota bacterium]
MHYVTWKFVPGSDGIKDEWIPDFVGDRSHADAVARVIRQKGLDARVIPIQSGSPHTIRALAEKSEALVELTRARDDLVFIAREATRNEPIDSPLRARLQRHLQQTRSH